MFKQIFIVSTKWSGFVFLYDLFVRIMCLVGNVFTGIAIDFWVEAVSFVWRYNNTFLFQSNVHTKITKTIKHYKNILDIIHLHMEPFTKFEHVKMLSGYLSPVFPQLRLGLGWVALRFWFGNLNLGTPNFDFIQVKFYHMD